MDGAYLSDNKIGVDIDVDHSDVISNSVIIGSSNVYQNFVESVGAAAYQWPEVALCKTENTLVGVRLDSFHDGHLFGATGTSLRNVTFSGFGPTKCPGSTVLHVDDSEILYFDTRNSIEEIIVSDDSRKIDLCDGEPQVAIRDIDGSFFGEPGFIISDTNAILAHPDCNSIASSCAAFCPGVCLRSLTVAVPSYYDRGALTLELSGTLPDGRAITPIYVQDFQTKDIKVPLKESSHGRLFVTLPAGGNYNGRFFLNNEPIWPLYTNLQYEDTEGNCGPDFASFEIDKLDSAQCSQLVQNGEFETSVDNWWHVGNLGLAHVDGGANGSSKALMAPNAAQDGGGRWVGVGQYLDTRCIEEGYTYALSAKVKLTNSVTGVLFQCNLSGYSSDEASCPKATLRFVNNIDGVTSWPSVGTMQQNDNEWNTIEGTFVATAENAAAHAVFLYISGAPADVDITVDAISFTRTIITSPPSAFASASPSASPDVINSPFEASNYESVQFDEESIRLVTESSQDSTVVTKMAHIGDLDMIVHFQDRFVSDNGYQPQLVLFFAPETASVDDLTTNDNGFGPYFESTVVAWMRERVYCCMDHTWFTAKANDMDGGVTTSSGSIPQKMATSGSLRLKRTGGSISAYYSFDNGVVWSQIGSDVLLPASNQTAPLKMGFRIKREWKASYDVTTIPIISSDGEIDPTDNTDPRSSFNDDNTDRQSATCEEGGCVLAGPDYNAIVLSKASFTGDVTLIVKVKKREMFGEGYQSGLWLFFAPEDATLASIPANDDDFRNYVVATVGDKIFPSIEHTWTEMSSQDALGRIDQHGGDGWQNTDGYLKLQCIGGNVKASMSANGNGWMDIGELQPLPFPDAPMKVGLRTQRNWAPGYNVEVIPQLIIFQKVGAAYADVTVTDP